MKNSSWTASGWNTIYGHGIEEADQILERESFRFIVSGAVLHNDYDMEVGLQQWIGCSNPAVTCAIRLTSAENMFSSREMYPLTFLTISERIYRMMASDSGGPDPKVIGDYREQIQKGGYKTKLFISTILGHGPLIPHKEKIGPGVDYGEATVSLTNEIRPKLAEPFRNLPEAELATAGIFLVAQKPPRSPHGQDLAGKASIFSV